MTIQPYSVNARLTEIPVTAAAPAAPVAVLPLVVVLKLEQLGPGHSRITL